ncbi:hypothetical protein KC19_4G181500 [Ceratodon purpureus]|uniref:Uncharacterized protein n=1 Tax=Ceratodon purpureus TaxID=3225 RepID=A0A8T0I9U6_CERPU|nr:hypothetical protein KC19_4G181500 [Ceratodon purpureus]
MKARSARCLSFNLRHLFTALAVSLYLSPGNCGVCGDLLEFSFPSFLVSS